MSPRRVFALGAALTLAGCATPSQVRSVATQVAVLDREHARADSARAADLARVQMMQRQNMDSINLLVSRLNDAIQRMGRDNAANFDNLMKQMYAVSNLASNTQSTVKRLSSQVETTINTPVPAANSNDTTRGGPPSASDVARPDVLLQQAESMIGSSAFGSARSTLNRLIATYPQSPEAGEAVYFLGYSFDVASPSQPDSARTYYTRAWTTYPTNPRASTALYKLGLVELKAGNLPAARKLWQTILDKYPQSDEVESARARLRENP